jgi:hypothetical protein
MSTVVTASLPVKIQPGDKDWKIFEKEIANATVHMETGTCNLAPKQPMTN